MTEEEVRSAFWWALTERADGLALDDEQDRAALVDILIDVMIEIGVMADDDEE